MHFVRDIIAPAPKKGNTEKCEKTEKNHKIHLTNAPCFAIMQKLSGQRIAYGGIAQLGERLNGIQEVSGSIPLISTTKCPEFFGIQGFFFIFGTKKFCFCIPLLQGCNTLTGI